MQNMEDQPLHNNDIKAQILKDIEERGFHLAYVDTDGYCPRFGYTIGLSKKFNHPELIIIGLNPESTGAILNNAVDEIETGTKFLQGINYDGFLVNMPVQFVEVEQDHYKDYLGYAGWYNDNSFDFEAMQIVWPDREGNFPWDEEFNKDWKFQQPLLDRNTDFKFLEERNTHVYTTSEVLEGKPILYVFHNDDGDWQFHSEAEPDIKKGKLVCLEHLVKSDPSLNDIYFLNFGESASRESPEHEWQIFAAEEDASR